MRPPVRLAGWGRLDDAIVTWTMAEGRRGRRWREVITRDDAVVHSLLLETDVERRFSHLELSVPGALVTLHPEADGTLHGNRVSSDQAAVQHVIGLAFEPGALVVVEGSPISAAAIAWALGPTGAAPSAMTRPVVPVDVTGHVGPAIAVAVTRSHNDDWRIGDGELFTIDADGIPRLLDGSIEPLETGPWTDCG